MMKKGKSFFTVGGGGAQALTLLGSSSVVAHECWTQPLT
jgi:hypothetical protein